MDPSVAQVYGKRVRVRACGLCWQNESLLMVNHSGVAKNNFWAPPGGGIEFGQTASETLKREFREETGIVVRPGRFLFVCEFINDPLHAIELFFEAHYESGELLSGYDPEMKNTKQIIQKAQWMPATAIKVLSEDELHGIFRECHDPSDIMHLNGYWRI